MRGGNRRVGNPAEPLPVEPVAVPSRASPGGSVCLVAVPTERRLCGKLTGRGRARGCWDRSLSPCSLHGWQPSLWGCCWEANPMAPWPVPQGDFLPLTSALPGPLLFFPTQLWVRRGPTGSCAREGGGELSSLPCCWRWCRLGNPGPGETCPGSSRALVIGPLIRLLPLPWDFAAPS